MKYKGVAFDLFGTLLKKWRNDNSYLALFRLLNVDVRESARLGMTTNVSFRELAELLRPGHGLNLDILEDHLQADLDAVQLYNDTLDVITALRNNGIPVAAISNIAQPFAVRARELLALMIDTMVLSCEVGLLKPDPRIFHLVAKQLQLQPADILFVGDSVRDDVAGADAAGMAVRLLDRNGVADSRYKNRSISALRQILTD